MILDRGFRQHPDDAILKAPERKPPNLPKEKGLGTISNIPEPSFRAR